VPAAISTSPDHRGWCRPEASHPPPGVTDHRHLHHSPRNHRLAVLSIALVAYLLATRVHEGLGQGSACLLTGIDLVGVSTVGCDCDKSGLGPWAVRANNAVSVLRFPRNTRPPPCGLRLHLRCTLWPVVHREGRVERQKAGAVHPHVFGFQPFLRPLMLRSGRGGKPRRRTCSKENTAAATARFMEAD